MKRNVWRPNDMDGASAVGRVVRLLMVVLALAACGSSSAPPPQPVAQRAALPPRPPGPDPYALLASYGPAALAQVRMALAALPCPLPGLPPELARLVDCSLVASARVVATTPIPVDPRLLPPQVDHRAMGLVGLVRDQGQVGSCTAQAIASIYDSAARRAGRPQLYGSAMDIFALYKAPGADNFTTALRRPTTSEAVWPYQPRKACTFEDEPSLSYCASHYGIAPVSGYLHPAAIAERNNASQWPAFSLERAEGVDVLRDPNQLAALVAAGEPVMLAVEMAYNWSSADWRGSVLPPPEGVLGPHALVLRGYRYGPYGREWLVQNSWGTQWGEGGFAWMNEQSLLATQMYALRIHVRVVG